MVVANTTSPNSNFLKNILGFKIPGTEITLAGLLLSLFALVGSIPVVKYILSMFIPESMILYVATLLLSAIAIYYLLLTETNSVWLQRHPVAFLTLTVLILMVMYNYLPEFKLLLGGETSKVVGQLIAMLPRR